MVVIVIADLYFLFVNFIEYEENIFKRHLVVNFINKLIKVENLV